jgi:hypothetical protein
VNGKHRLLEGTPLDGGEKIRKFVARSQEAVLNSCSMPVKPADTLTTGEPVGYVSGEIQRLRKMQLTGEEIVIR